ncbi:MAG: presenilin family intramembrane aspartyl protease [Nanoarchaeota archaeon]
MKYQWKITSILITMFLVAQIIGLYVAHVYTPESVQVLNQTSGELENKTVYAIPYGMAPPEDIEPASSVTSILIALAIAVCLMLVLMRLKAEIFLRGWFFLVVIIGIALALNAFFYGLPYASLVSLIIATPLAYLKIFKRNMYAHNGTELLIYPGIASVFIPLLSIPSAIILLVLISAYDMYAVWHVGFMQKMARYQIETLRLFSGFFIPYLGKKERIALQRAKTAGNKNKKVPVHIAILGGGDIVFPIIIAGLVLQAWGLVPALIVTLGATLGLTFLFYISKKGKFYPAMPFISVGCFIGLAIAYIIR